MIKLNEIFGWKVGVGVMIVLILFYVVFFPLCVAWALNYLFHLTIPYSFDTWVAVSIISMFLHTKISAK
jgi:hypothetical protein